MLISEVGLKSLAGTWGYAVRAPAAALLTTVAASLLARTRRGRMLEPVGVGLGVLAGWIVLAGLSFKFSGPLSRLPALALLAIVGQAILGGKPNPKLASAVIFVLSLLCAWWLYGAPHSVVPPWAPPWRDGLKILAVAAWILAIVWLARGSDPWRTAAAAAALAVALHAVGAASPWPLVALVPAAAAIGSVGQASKTVFLLPACIAIATAAAAASLIAGRSLHGRFGPVEAACLSVPVTFWLVGRIGKKFRRPGGLQRALAGVLVFGLVSLVALSAAALAGLR